MARPLRVQYPNAYYHVMNRGNSGEAIFITDSDRATFLDGLADSCETFGVDYRTVSQSRARLKAKLKSSRKLKKQFHQIRDHIINLSNSKI